MITEKEWIQQVKMNKDKLRILILTYHPNRNPLTARYATVNTPITAQGAELACASIRRTIQNKGDLAPEVRFDLALMQDDVEGIEIILNEVWFGVPESTSCWDIPGFKEAVNLLENLPGEA